MRGGADAAAEATETEAAAEATETAEAAEATEKALPGEPETAGTNPPAQHASMFSLFFSSCFCTVYLSFFFSMHHHTFCLFMFKRGDPVSDITYTDTYALCNPDLLYG
jgi:hypothetical protein